MSFESHQHNGGEPEILEASSTARISAEITNVARRTSKASRGAAKFAAGAHAAEEEVISMYSKPRNIIMPTDKSIKEHFEVKIRKCCAIEKSTTKSVHGCFAQQFLYEDQFSDDGSGYSVDYTKLCQVVKRFRHISIEFSEKTFDKFVIDKIRNCMVVSLKPSENPTDSISDGQEIAVTVMILAKPIYFENTLIYFIMRS